MIATASQSKNSQSRLDADEPDTVRLTEAEARAIGETAVQRIGYTAEDARIVVDQLIDNMLCGYKFAGLPRADVRTNRSGVSGQMVAKAEADYAEGDKRIDLVVTDTGGASSPGTRSTTRCVEGSQPANSASFGSPVPARTLTWSPRPSARAVVTTMPGS